MFNRKYILKKLGQLLLHLIFWCGVLLFYTYFFGYGTTDISYVISFSLFLMPITMATTYVSIYQLIPVYWGQKKYFLFGLYSVYTLIISAYLIFLSIFYGLIYLSKFNYTGMAPISRNLLFVMLGVYLVVILASAYKSLRISLRHSERNRLLENKILETQLKLKEQELNYLKMQIHPHFLFNTLNTLYGFALKKADQTPEMILRLSNLLDYLLYQADKPFVLLTEEIEHIKDYTTLEKMRFNHQLEVNLFIDDFPDTVKIAPMLLLPFIENSFKHGKAKNGLLKITVNLTWKDHVLFFKIANTCATEQATEKVGIGLKNIQKRLQLLYKNKYELIFEEKKDEFIVQLTLTTH